MKILQQAVKVKRGSRVVVNFSQPSTIYLMTEVNFKRYKDGASFRRIGGAYNNSPAEFVAPYDGTWHAVIERGSHANPINVTGSVEVLPPIRKEISYFDDEDTGNMNVASEASDSSSEENTSSDTDEAQENEVDNNDSSEENEDEEKS